MPQTTSKPDKTVSDEVYISIPEAIERGYSSRATINRWINDGSVRALRMGNRTMVCEADLVARIEERKVLHPRRAYAAVAQRLAQLAPVFSVKQKKRLVELLSDVKGGVTTDA